MASSIAVMSKTSPTAGHRYIVQACGIARPDPQPVEDFFALRNRATATNPVLDIRFFLLEFCSRLKVKTYCFYMGSSRNSRRHRGPNLI
jgi:hypothetical protein